jgi:hypothetical protein
MLGLTRSEIIIALVVIVFVWELVTPPDWARHHVVSPQSACVNNLRLIESGKRQWASEHHKQSADIPTETDLQPYIGYAPDHNLPTCPVDSANTFITSYDPRSVGEKPVCRIVPEAHVFPRHELLYDISHSDLTGDIIRWVVILGIAFAVIFCRRRM